MNLQQRVTSIFGIIVYLIPGGQGRQIDGREGNGFVCGRSLDHSIGESEYLIFIIIKLML